MTTGRAWRGDVDRGAARRAWSGADDGQAMVIVVMVLFILMLLGTSLVVQAANRSSLSLADYEQHAAQSAAQYGLSSFMTFLQEQSNWPQTCGTPSKPGWCFASVGVPNAPGETFDVQPDQGQLATCATNMNNPTGPGCTVDVTVTGTDKGARAFAKVSLYQPANSFLQYVYYTEYETSDPADSQIYGTNPDDEALAVQNCQADRWQANSRGNAYYKRGPNYRNAWRDAEGQTLPLLGSGCTLIQFGSSDVLDGPVFSDDTFCANGATFNSTVQSADPEPGTYSVLYQGGRGACAGRGSSTFQFGQPSVVSGLILPPKNLSTPESAASLSGCLYTGPTQITLHPDYLMTVVSPDTLAVPGFYAPQCGAPGYTIDRSTGSLMATGGCLAQSFGCSVNICPAPAFGCLPPAGAAFDGALYVQSFPTDPADPNYWGSVSAPNWPFDPGFRGNANRPCPYIDGETQAPIGFNGNNAVYPPGYRPLGGGNPESVDCSVGDAYVEGDPDVNANADVVDQSNPGGNPMVQSEPGAYDAKLTIAAANNIAVVGNLTYNQSGGASATQGLGLVADNFIEVNNPQSNYAGDDPWPTVTDGGEGTVIDAALLASQHSFTVLNWSQGNGSAGWLNITGTISQTFRGIVKENSGYDKKYMWDSNLVQYPPPFFPVPQFVPVGYSQG